MIINTKLLYDSIKLRGILTLLGIRYTKGSVDTFPPHFDQLLTSFQQIFTPTSANPLTVGARALTKHCIRSKDNWWDKMDKGNDLVKNEHAFNIICKLINEAVWLNNHLLPHDVYIFEIRIKEGYGCRWSISGDLFRGFLEPPMKDGFEKKWIH